MAVYTMRIANGMFVKHNSFGGFMISVYHVIEMTFGEISLEFTPANYRKVAEVTCHEFDIFELTNHIDKFWWDNPQVNKVGEGRYRSTSVGDVYVTETGAAFRFLNAGVEEISNTFVQQ